jgi:hypothetical protein
MPVVPAIIGAGAALGGAAIAAHGVTSAANTQAASSDKALQLQKELYEQQRRDLTPYRAAGQGAIGQLGYGLGVSGFEGGPTSQMAPSRPALPPTMDPNALVTLQSPDGSSTKQMTMADAAPYIQKGAKIVGSGGWGGKLIGNAQTGQIQDWQSQDLSGGIR